MTIVTPRRAAPELRVRHWIDARGEDTTPVTLQELGAGPRILFAFQDWCPGCHSQGFPTLRTLVDALTDDGVGFAAIQTVFEGASHNTVDRLRENQRRYDLAIPFGHDVPMEGATLPSFMEDYGTGGTPWFTVIDGNDEIVHAGFRLDARRFLDAFQGMR